MTLKPVDVLLAVAAVLVAGAYPAVADDNPGDRHPAASAGESSGEASGDHDELALPDEPIPMLEDADLPPRPRPLVEWGEPLLGLGPLGKGFKIPTGAIWRPTLWVFGGFRTGVNYVDSGSDRDGDRIELLEWASRLDLFANLQLTGTERLVVGVQPLQQDGRFSTYTWRPEDDSGWSDELNGRLTTVFFEGELGQLFPHLDRSATKPYDIGFAVGRQQIEFQDGIMFNDRIDSIGLTRNTMSAPGIPNWRATFLFGWGDLDRGDGREDEDALVVGLFNELDLRHSTVDIDVAWVPSSDDGTEQVGSPGGGDGLYWGLGAIRSFGFWNTTLRVNGSHALDRESAAVSDGVLVFGELSTTPRGTHDVAYANVFVGIDRYTSAARDPTVGGPLGQTGLLFAAVGLGRFPAALGNLTDDSWGGALGYQRFWDHERTQLTLEVGGRDGTGFAQSAVAVGTRLQRKLAQRWLLQLDGYVAWPERDDRRIGVRSELQVRF